MGARLRPQAALGRGLGALLTEERRPGSGASGGRGRGERANWHPHSSWATRSRARTTDAGPASPGVPRGALPLSRVLPGFLGQVMGEGQGLSESFAS